MDEREWPAERFEEHRTRLRAVAYRMLGSVSEADDAVQEAWLRLNRTDTSSVDNLGAWLTTVVGRVCLNMLRSRERRREDPVEAHALDPIVGSGHGGRSRAGGGAGRLGRAGATGGAGDTVTGRTAGVRAA
ncbi:MAG TPA: sigma factor [Actinomadura sp.]|nr:sigma factor [Actinomadura sp.]